jgi:hypothetical protein
LGGAGLELDAVLVLQALDDDAQVQSRPGPRSTVCFVAAIRSSF